MTSQTHATGSPWIVIVCALTIVSLSMGMRQSFGLLLPQMGPELSIGRADFGLALAIQNLVWGIVQPWVGAFADRHGAGRVALAGLLLYTAGLIGAALAGNALGIHLTLGFLIGLSLSGVTFGVMLGAVGRVVPADRRGMAFGIVTAGGSFGQFLMVPGAQALLGTVGYHMTLTVMAGLVALGCLAVPGIAGRPRQSANAEAVQSAVEALREALGQRSFRLLTAGFFVCGFQIAFIATHFPAYLADKGIAPGVGASALALIGLFNIFGSWFFGMAGDRWRKHHALAVLYTARGLLFAAFVALPLSASSALVFAACLGFLWLGTIPLTNGLVGQIFGVRHLSMLSGIVFLSHQCGSFFGAWLAGYLYDLTGSYDATWTASIALAFLAALIHLPIRDAPLSRAGAAA